MSFSLLSPALQQSVEVLRGVGSDRREQLQRLHIESVADLLGHFPRGYDDLTDVRPITKLEEDRLQTVQGEVVEMDGRRLADGRTIVQVVISDDGTHSLAGVWFNQPFITRRFRYGQRLAFSGKPKWRQDHWEMPNPRVQPLVETTGEQAPGIVPIYALTEDLRSDVLRRLIQTALDRFAGYLPEVLPPDLRLRRGLPVAAQAVRDIHAPASLDQGRLARRRFVYEEFLLLQLALGLRRRDLRDRQRAPRLPVTTQIDQRIRRLFPFRLTCDQDQAIGEICRDLASDRPMQRLLQADVGAGKTAVAIYAMLAAVANQHQAILMAPTEVLARQHMRTLDAYLAQSRVRRLLLTGGLPARARRDALQAIAAGEVDLVVGTQALVQDDVQFAKLGLAVIDEQHKFGVDQRARVRKLGVDPHYLVMTATPIPRTVALTVFGDLDVSTIRELPPGRRPVTTRWQRPSQREPIYETLRSALREGRQGYVVCPLVEESATLDLKAAEQTYQELQDGAFREFRLGLLHGRQDEATKAEIMQRFRWGEIQLLVSTVVIEVGVDVANATLLLVEHADRFGLSQLHQLRGRVSRGTVPGQCWLLADPTTDEARERLRIVTRTTDGFELAEHDARLRGLGEFFGTRQHGLGDLHVADLLADREVLRQAREDAFALVLADAGLRHPDHALLRRAVLERYGKTLDLAEIG
ncbi:MAG: ATP-dependent DNA helicase RecG [Planctomycetia bacterium]|nr:ATP-dependent DNA helicase RecG [Planctomycetia bacterium]